MTGETAEQKVKWLLIVLAVQTSADYPLPYEYPRGSLQGRFNNMVASWMLTRELNTGVPYDSEYECRRAGYMLRFPERPDTENSPDDGREYRTLCKPVRAAR
jgi:hypothetical protein